MNVLVDSSIWSLAFRRNPAQLSQSERVLLQELRLLLEAFTARLVGAIRQEVLSGIRSIEQYEDLRERMRSFEDEKLSTEDYELAAEMTNLCTAKGIAGSSVDFLICAVAASRGWPIFTSDKDFQRYSSVLPTVVLHKPRPSTVQ